MSFVLALLAATSLHLSGGAGPPDSRWVAPLPTPLTVVHPFDPPPPLQPWRPGNRGVDLAAPPGAEIVAAGAGVVSFAGPLAGRGVVVVVHGPLRTTYEPVRAVVVVGQSVRAGEEIGTLQAQPSPCGAQACLHWGLLRGEVYLDPLLLLSSQVRLLPQYGGGLPLAYPAMTFTRSSAPATVARPVLARSLARPRASPAGAPLAPSVPTGLALWLAGGAVVAGAGGAVGAVGAASRFARTASRAAGGRPWCASGRSGTR
jgi:Peptidase family M23